MTADDVKRKMLAIVGKYDRGVFTMEDASDALWQLAQAVDDADRQRITVSSHDD